MATIRLIAPTGEIREVPEDQAKRFLDKGAARAVRMVAPNGHVADVPEHRVDHFRNRGAVLADPTLPVSHPPPGLSGPTTPTTAPDIGGAALRGLGLPSSRAEWSAALRDPLADVNDAIHEGRYGHAMVALGKHILPMVAGPGGALVRESVDQLQRAHRALQDVVSASDLDTRASRTRDAISHLGAAAIPLFGPAANAAEDNPGDPIGGAVQGGVNLLTNLLGGANLREAGLGMDEIRAARSAIAPKHMVEALQPRNAIDAMKEYPETLSILKHEVEPVMGKPITYETLPEALDIAQEYNRGHFRRYMTRAEQVGQTIDGNKIADAMVDSIPSKLRLEHPEVAKSLEAQADLYRKNFKPTEMEDFIRTNNAQLQPTLAKLPAAEYQDLASHTNKQILEAQTRAMRDETYRAVNAVDPVNAGPGVKELQRRYGLLKEMRTDLENLQNSRLKQVEDTGGIDLGDVAHAVVSPKSAVAKAIFNKLSSQKALVDAPDKINAAFANWQGPRLSAVPEPGGRMIPQATALANPPGELTKTPRGEFIRQRALPEEDISARKGGPFEEEIVQPPQLELFPTEHTQTDWQQLLFPSQPEGPAPGHAAGPIPGRPVESTPQQVGPQQQSLNIEDILNAVRRISR